MVEVKDLFEVVELEAIQGEAEATAYPCVMPCMAE